jgi:hypothetical protein
MLSHSISMTRHGRTQARACTSGPHHVGNGRIGATPAVRFVRQEGEARRPADIVCVARRGLAISWPLSRLAFRPPGAEGGNLTDVLFALGGPGIERNLQADPDSCAGAKQFAQPNRHGGRYQFALPQNIVKMFDGRYREGVRLRLLSCPWTTFRMTLGEMNHRLLSDIVRSRRDRDRNQAARLRSLLIRDSAGLPSPSCNRQIILSVSDRRRLSTSWTRFRLPMKGIRSRGLSPF